jgi:signal transduction histidine kinase
MSLAAWIVLSILLSPLLVAGVRVHHTGVHLDVTVIVAVVGLVLLAAFGPPIAVGVARIERQRLRLIDTRPVRSGHTGNGLWSLYTDTATWRELAYLLLLAIVVPIWGLILGLAGLVVGGLLVTPLAAAFAHGDGVVVGPAEVYGALQGIPFALLGLALLPIFGYAVALVAGVHGALARALLHAEPDASQRELVEVVRSRARLVDAFDAERRRIERDLHDGAQQRLVSLSMHLGLASMDLTRLSRSLAPAATSLEAESGGGRVVPGGGRVVLDGGGVVLDGGGAGPDAGGARSDPVDPVPAASMTDQLAPVVVAVAAAQQEAKALMVELRELIHGINPRTLTELGLAAALTELAERSPVPIEVHTTIPDRLPSHVESVAYFAVSEALANIAKHSGATEANVTAVATPDELVIEVRDNGRGGADPAGGTGLTGLADRVAAAGGRLLLSSPDGGPTRLRLELPCP